MKRKQVNLLYRDKLSRQSYGLRKPASYLKLNIPSVIATAQGRAGINTAGEEGVIKSTNSGKIWPFSLKMASVGVVNHANEGPTIRFEW
jgi:hypothetical protein